MTQITENTEQAFEPIVRLTAQWRRGGAWLGPAWAVLCGILASAQFQWSGNAVIPILVAIILAEGLWTTLWAAIAETDWARALERWRNWQAGEPLKHLPFTQPDSPAAHLALLLGQFRNWAMHDLSPNYGNALTSAIVAPVIALVLSAILGAPVVLLTILAICIPQLAVIACRGNARPNPILRGFVEMTLPMLLGFVVLKPLSVEIVIAAIGFGIAYAGALRPVWDIVMWNLGQALVFLLLLAMRHPIGAFAMVLLWLPQFLMQAQHSARKAQWWFMAIMLVASLAIA
ncbi:MAG: hypothetical protein M1546_27585 [Chloroflexi bacterium]|nr:hypothetical protein [Chloroflexota bacterium]